jgi:translation initiation factor 1A
MPKKKAKKNTKNNFTSNVVRQIVYKEEGQEYAFISKILGGRRFTAECFDGKSRIAIVRNKRLRIDLDNIVLVGLREFEDKTVDIIWKYTSLEVKILEKESEIPSGTSGKMKNNTIDDDDDIPFEFDEI